MLGCSVCGLLPNCKELLGIMARGRLEDIEIRGVVLGDVVGGSRRLRRYLGLLQWGLRLWLLGLLHGLLLLRLFEDRLLLLHIRRCCRFWTSRRICRSCMVTEKTLSCPPINEALGAIYTPLFGKVCGSKSRKNALLARLSGKLFL